MAQRCGHCGRDGTLIYVKDVVLSEAPTEITHGGGAIEETTNQRILQVRRCSQCDQPTLATYQYVDGWSDPSDYMDFRQIYPALRELDDLPPRIGQRYNAMLELAHAPDAFAVRAGRLLEAVCADQGISSGDLGSRLDELAGKRRATIPKPLADQAHLVREFRNIGGHDDDVEVEEGDVPLIRGFVEALLEFLYWGPAELERGRSALAGRINRGQVPGPSGRS